MLNLNKLIKAIALLSNASYKDYSIEYNIF
jgi:hypothetical protein